MPQSFERQERVADVIKHEIAKVLGREIKDPRIGFVTVTRVELSGDYSQAKVFITLLDESKLKETLKALNQAAGFVRYQLAHSINMRTTPKLRFYFDEASERGRRLSKLLNSPPSSSE